MDVATRSATKPQGFSNRFVAAVLTSRINRVFSRRMCLVAYCGQRTGRSFVTPTQYVRIGDVVAVLIARPEAKTWWKNFRRVDGWPLDLLVAGEWCEMTGQVVDGAPGDDDVAPLLDAYLEAFPAASKLLCADVNDSGSEPRVVFVKCEGRLSSVCEHDSRPCFECMIGC